MEVRRRRRDGNLAERPSRDRSSSPVAHDQHRALSQEWSNHLDVESIEALEDAIERYPGTVLLVSHDRALLRAIPKTRRRRASGRKAGTSERPIKSSKCRRPSTFRPRARSAIDI